MNDADAATADVMELKATSDEGKWTFALSIFALFSIFIGKLLTNKFVDVLFLFSRFDANSAKLKPTGNIFKYAEVLLSYDFLNLLLCELLTDDAAITPTPTELPPLDVDELFKFIPVLL